ncbi:MAG: hypothetical protein WCH01_19635, partial [Methylococcaceae bacterium]
PESRESRSTCYNRIGMEGTIIEKTSAYHRIETGQPFQFTDTDSHAFLPGLSGMKQSDAVGDLGNASRRPTFCLFIRHGLELKNKNIAGSVGEDIKPMDALQSLEAAEITWKSWFSNKCQTILQNLLDVWRNDPVKMAMQKLFYVATEPREGIRTGTLNAKVAWG